LYNTLIVWLRLNFAKLEATSNAAKHKQLRVYCW